MSRRLSLLAAVVAALLLVPSALAVRVRVRVEGKTRTIFGAAEPRLQARGTALSALDAASIAGEFYYHLTISSLGSYVDQIGRYPATASTGWMFKVNGVAPQVGANAVRLKAGDTVLWYWGRFGPKGGPATLVLQRAGARACYRVLSQDDAGKTKPARGAILHVGSRSIRTRTGSACIGRHRALVRATLKGAVRSNALP